MQRPFLLLFLLIAGFRAFSQIDQKATRETKALYANLKRMQKQGVLFGHQDGLAYGLNRDSTRWMGEENRSDVKAVSGEFPAVIGWDLGKMEFDSARNLDGVPFELMKKRIVEHYQRGGINTVSWHPNNPIDPSKTTWDKVDSTLKRVLNDKKSLKAYKKWLDKAAVFFKSLETSDGTLVPIIYRPYHEHTGSWFWWGAGHCSPEEYKEFWQMTVKYLQKKKKVHNLLIAYSTDRFTSKEHYLERYPGNEWVDMVGFDLYHRNAPASNEAFKTDFKRMVTTLQEVATENEKPCAVTEMGLEKVTEAHWWTEIVLPVVQDTKLSYFLVWRNGRPNHYYAPFEGQKSAADFMKMIQSGKVWLERKTADQRLYQNK